MEQPILAIDPTGRRRDAEEVELRAHGPTVRVDAEAGWGLRCQCCAA